MNAFKTQNREKLESLKNQGYVFVKHAGKILVFKHKNNGRCACLKLTNRPTTLYGYVAQKFWQPKFFWNQNSDYDKATEGL